MQVALSGYDESNVEGPPILPSNAVVFSIRIPNNVLKAIQGGKNQVSFIYNGPHSDHVELQFFLHFLKIFASF
jgi:hypothetical protein